MALSRRTVLFQTVLAAAVLHTGPLPAQEPEMTMPRPALQWGVSERPGGGHRYWRPEDIAGIGANMVSVYYRPLTENGEIIHRVGLIPPELLKQILADARPEIEQSHEAGIRIIGYADCIMICPPLMAEAGLDATPLYALDRHGEPPSQTYYDPAGVFFSCVNNPGWLQLQQEVARVTAEAGIDGLMLDAYPLAFPPGYQCCCRYCKDIWKEVSERIFGESMPLPGDEKGVLDLSRRVDREYLTWRFQTYVDFVKAIEAEILQTHPDFMLVMNHAADTLDFGYQAAQGAFSHPSTEINHLRAGEQQSMYMYRFAEALMDYPMLTVVNDGKQIDPPWRNAVLLAETTASGGAQYVSAYKEHVSFESSKQHYSMMRADPEWFADTESAANVALVYSWRDHCYVQQKHYGPYFELTQGDQNYRNGGTLLTRLQIPYDCVVADGGFTAGELARYTAIVLPQVRLLADDDLHALREYAEEGGQLVIIGEFGDLQMVEGEILPRDSAALSWAAPGGRVYSLPGSVLTADANTASFTLPPVLEESRIRLTPSTDLTATVRRTDDRISIHIIRYGDPAEVAERAVTVRYRLPEGRTLRDLHILSPVRAQRNLRSAAEVIDGDVVLQVDDVGSYALIAIEMGLE